MQVKNKRRNRRGEKAIHLWRPRYTRSIDHGDGCVSTRTTNPARRQNCNRSCYENDYPRCDPTDDYSGVSATQYRLDGGGWVTYWANGAPVNAPIVVSDVGSHTLEFYSGDNVGNEEEVNTANFEVTEVAEVLETSPATVKRDWRFARAWLDRELREDARDDG